MTQTPVTETPAVAPVTLASLGKQREELRTAMMAALTEADDAKVKRLSNELAATNKYIIDLEATSQGDDRIEYMGKEHDALVKFEVDGLELTVVFDAESEAKVTSVAFRPTQTLMDSIIKAVNAVERPSSATKWIYGRDEKGEHSFEFNIKTTATRKPSTTTGTNGTRTTGWKAPDGSTVTLGDAFDKVATAAQKTEYGTKTGGSAQHSFKSGIVIKSGYSKL